ncbi:MAG: hypothetical protein GEV28_28070 [Actinophytocola sp.]|uniref:hypothetical protein n=1 Tax=Actinophytocola sp. TaxID=1872138 RepID=UPI00132661BA|nr:hypothetical protein [Actinophytocola sp.]MPZ84042.1 hypothetical protein [Actinophytocola sp.]
MKTTCDRFCWMTSQDGGVEHAVTDDAQASGIEAGKGWFEPLCGQGFLVACMDAGPRGRCARCELFVRARADLRDFEQRMTEYRRPGWLSRLLCRYKQPAGVGDPTEPLNAPTSAGLQPSAGAVCAPEDLTTASAIAPAGAHRRGRHAA